MLESFENLLNSIRNNGPAVFPHDAPFDSESNYSHLLDFMIQNDFPIASTRFERSPSRIVTYRENFIGANDLILLLLHPTSPQSITSLSPSVTRAQ